ncbi:Protein TIC [Arachis hypogaea]|nr:Protein TIC [Arachis hypogaea]
MSQFFFDTCQNDGKERISFASPPNLSTFLQMMEKRIDSLTREKIFYDELNNYWNSQNEEKKKKLSNEILNRAEVLDKEFIPLDIFQKRIRLCNEETQTKNLPKLYDPFLNGPCRGRMNNFLLSSINNKTYKKDDIWINKIHGLLLSSIQKTSYFEENMDIFYQKLFLTEISFFFNLIHKFSEKSVSALNFEGLVFFPEHAHITPKKIQFLFDAIRTDLKDKTIKKKNVL